MWRAASVVILVLYVVCAVLLLAVAWTFADDPVEYRPPGGVWIAFLAFIIGLGAGLLCIYLAVQFLRHELGPASPVKSLVAVAALILGWLVVFICLGLRPSNAGELLTHPWRLHRLLPWGIVGVLLCWMLAGLLGRPRAPVSGER